VGLHAGREPGAPRSESHRTHQQVSLDASDGLARDAIDEVPPHLATLGPTEPDEVVTSMDAFGAKPVEHGAVKHSEQLAPMD
jgi:hypothetical protein